MASFHIGILPDRPLADFQRWLPGAEALGIEGVWVADSQSVFRDAYMALALFGQVTKRMMLATGVTNVVTRHPAVLAQSFATLDETSGGRAILGVGVGCSAVANIGVAASKLKRLEEVIGVLRRLMDGRAACFDGVELRVSWPARRVPIVLACTGPKSLELGGRVADGVLFQVGAEPALVEYARHHIEIGARASGRDPSRIRIYQRLACGVSGDREQIRREVRGYAAVAARTVFTAVPRKYFPRDLWADLQRMQASYDFQRHGSMHAPQAGLVTDRILDAIAISGTPEEAVPRFRTLMDLGIGNFVLPVAMQDPESQVRSLASDVLAFLRNAPTGSKRQEKTADA